jgi:hypothetical protein
MKLKTRIITGIVCLILVAINIAFVSYKNGNINFDLMSLMSIKTAIAQNESWGGDTDYEDWEQNETNYSEQTTCFDANMMPYTCYISCTVLYTDCIGTGPITCVNTEDTFCDDPH